ncbi:pleckstrin homology-like domain-containing protein [Puntigrus tetrazona]|uniref:pleckstrin homology-like domain-containing protein n=1 Tax=Puntigrus tetrazona TaxID=1606681 RepID=UPI001C8A392D|nr:pleckstrin homology-like domain-containing protein [Puntigrus tetrazona]
MALESATSNGTTDENHPEEREERKKGWLFKKTHYTKRWKIMWFQIRDGQLVYGFNEQSAEKAINLVGATVEMLEGDAGRFGWTLTPKHKKRTYILRANTAEEQQAWMSAICEAQLTSEEHSSNACVLQ